MAGIILGIVVLVLILFIALILIRAVLFRPEELPPVSEEQIQTDLDKIVEDMVAMIRCKTVSNRDEQLVDRKEFEKFVELLRERFPLVHSKCSLERIGKTGLLYYLKGNSSESPSVCMAHYDVVPVDEQG